MHFVLKKGRGNVTEQSIKVQMLNECGNGVLKYKTQPQQGTSENATSVGVEED